jgi:hypothetical protein
MLARTLYGEDDSETYQGKEFFQMPRRSKV